MHKYKVSIQQIDTYVVDVLAATEDEAKEKATKVWNGLCESGTYHYHQVGDTETDFVTVYDVTNTDDPFNP